MSDSMNLDSMNPWQSPGTEVKAEENSAAQGGLTATMIRYLKEASPWLRFIGILGYIGAGLLAVAGVIFTIVFAATGRTFGYAGSAVGAFAGLIYVVLAVISFFPARFTYYFGAKIRSYLLNNTEKDMEEAFKNNKSLWKFAGILAIVYLAFIPLGIIGIVIAAITSSIF
jgi:hypothetical protein